jgi:hypothetical protein
MDKMGTPAPLKDDRLSATTRYDFTDGQITRTDTYTPKAPLALAKIELEFAGFSQIGTQNGNTIILTGGGAREFKVEGLDRCTARNIDNLPDYRSDTGAMTHLISCQSGPKTIDRPITISWRLRYQ